MSELNTSSWQKNLVEKIKKCGVTAKETASNTKEILILRQEAQKLQKRLTDARAQLGEKYYQKFGFEPEEDMSSFCNEISECQIKLGDIEQKLTVLSGYVYCTTCGKQIRYDTKFCEHCGTANEQPVSAVHFESSADEKIPNSSPHILSNIIGRNKKLFVSALVVIAITVIFLTGRLWFFPNPLVGTWTNESTYDYEATMIFKRNGTFIANENGNEQILNYKIIDNDTYELSFGKRKCNVQYELKNDGKQLVIDGIIFEKED